jgi:hypothetical protein
MIKIHGKDYVTVAERVQELHSKYPNNNGYISISTKMIHNDGKTVVFKATVTIVTEGTSFDDPNAKLVCTGHASEKIGGNGVNETSAVENAETSAIGRALGFAGFGSIGSIASANEVIRATEKKEFKSNGNGNGNSGNGNGNETIRLATQKQVEFLQKLAGDRLNEILAENGVTVETLVSTKASELINTLKQA